MVDCTYLPLTKVAPNSLGLPSPLDLSTWIHISLFISKFQVPSSNPNSNSNSNSPRSGLRSRWRYLICYISIDLTRLLEKARPSPLLIKPSSLSHHNNSTFSASKYPNTFINATEELVTTTRLKLNIRLCKRFHFGNQANLKFRHHGASNTKLTKLLAQRTILRFHKPSRLSTLKSRGNSKRTWRHLGHCQTFRISVTYLHLSMQPTGTTRLWQLPPVHKTANFVRLFFSPSHHINSNTCLWLDLDS